MAASTSKVSAKISALDASLDELEAKLEPLFAQSLPESVVGLEKIQQAKLQVAIPYLVYDLVFSASTGPLYFKMSYALLRSLFEDQGHRP